MYARLLPRNFNPTQKIMPELPEVETIVKYLRPKLVGRKILDLKSNTPRLFRDHKNNPVEVRRIAVGRKIEEISRMGKNIIFRLSGGSCMLIHLMMTGKLLVDPKEKGKHDRMVIILSGGTRLVFNDIRKFGRCRIIQRGELTGEDALAVNFKKFKELIQSRNGKTKSTLLNQKILAGIGNIYADEILWYAGIRPLRKADSLKVGELSKLYKVMREVLNLAIKKEGTSSRDYRKPDGSEGGYYEIRKAYQRTGERCSLKDGGVIKRIIVGQRATHFCPKHQK